jgi:hypothetical protein
VYETWRDAGHDPELKKADGERLLPDFSTRRAGGKKQSA